MLGIDSQNIFSFESSSCLGFEPRPRRSKEDKSKTLQVITTTPRGTVNHWVIVGTSRHLFLSPWFVDLLTFSLPRHSTVSDYIILIHWLVGYIPSSIISTVTTLHNGCRCSQLKLNSGVGSRKMYSMKEAYIPRLGIEPRTHQL